MDDLVKQLREWFGTHPLIEEMIEENKRLRGLIVDAVYELEDGNARRAHAVLERAKDGKHD